jgi:hypothetical protein
MRKAVFLLLVISAYHPAFSQNNDDRAAELGNFGQYLQGFFENIIVNKNYDKLTNCKTGNYAEITFNIDTEGATKKHFDPNEWRS